MEDQTTKKNQSVTNIHIVDLPFDLYVGRFVSY